MKKLLFITLAAIFAIGVSAQTEKGSKSALIKAGYQTEFKRFGIGVEGRYVILENLRIAPDVIFQFPKDHTTGLDINLNVHYVFEVQDKLTVYPLAGLAVINNRTSSFTVYDVKIPSFGDTSIGFNLGVGAGYDISDNGFLNAEFKYTFNDWDFAAFMIGYGVRF